MPEVAYKDTYEQEEFTYRIPMLRSEINIVRRDVDTLKTDTAELKHDTSSMKSELTELKSNVRIIQNDVTSLKSDVRDKGEVRTLGAKIEGIDKRIDDLHESQTKWFTLLGLLITIVPIAIAIIQHVAGK